MISPWRIAALLASSVMAVLSAPAGAQTQVSDPWIRGTVAQQRATGAFMTITSATGARLVGAASPVAAVVEIHEMAMDGQVMRMRALKDGLDLPSGKSVELKPGGYHVMLMDLKQPLLAGQKIPLTLNLVSRDGKPEVLQLEVPVKALSTPAKGHHH